MYCPDGTASVLQYVPQGLVRKADHLAGYFSPAVVLHAEQDVCKECHGEKCIHGSRNVPDDKGA